MTTVAEALAAVEKGLSRDARVALEHVRAAMQAARPDGVTAKAQSDSARKKFYSSRAWRVVRYRVLKARGGRCEICGRTAKDGVVICVDHIKPVRHFWHLRLDEQNMQIACRECNGGKLSWDMTDWR